MVSVLTFRSVIHLKLNLVYGVQVTVLHFDIQLLKQILLKRFSSLHCLALYLLKVYSTYCLLDEAF